MPSKLKKAIGAVKDQTSISIAKVGNGSNNASNLEVAILKATSHDENPMDERYVNEILQLIASNKVYATTCAQVFARRIGKTRSWPVVLKSLMLVLRIFQDGDPYFPREVLHTMKNGKKILNLASFRDNSNSSPWDYTAYVRMFALYLDERLDCFLMGKLQKRVAFRRRESEQLLSTIMRDMKPSMLLDRISYWQRLLDRAIATRPTGAAKDNGLVQLSLYSVVQESFDLYRDISDGLALLLDSFFHLPYQSCVNAFHTCVKTSKQSEDLSSYYAFCMSLGIGRTSEYPSVQKISDELIETLREFLKDQASNPSNGRLSPPQFNPRSLSMTSDQFESFENSETSEAVERLSEKASDYGSHCTSLEDLMFMTDMGTSPSFTFDTEYLEEIEKQSGQEDYKSSNSSRSSHSTATSTATLPQETNANMDFVSFDDWPQPDEMNRHQGQGGECWEQELAEMANQSQPNPNVAAIRLFGDASPTTSLQTNPFLQEGATLDPSGSSSNDDFGLFAIAPPTFQAMPTFGVQNPGQNAVAAYGINNDPFASCDQVIHGSSSEQKLFYEQQLWLQNQNKIMERHLT